MQKNKKKLSLVKMIIICLILVLLSGVGVMAVTTQVNTVKIQLSNGYEMTVLTSKTNVKEILEDNNIILENNEKVTYGGRVGRKIAPLAGYLSEIDHFNGNIVLIIV